MELSMRTKIREEVERTGALFGCKGGADFRVEI
jgi:hypothetical protein